MIRKIVVASLLLVALHSGCLRPLAADTYGFTDNSFSPDYMGIQFSNTNKRLSYSFIAPPQCANRTVASVKFYVAWLAGPAVQLTLELRSDSGGLPGTLVATGATGTGTPGVSGQWYRIYLVTPCQIQVGQRYHVLIRPTSACSSSNYVYIGFPIGKHRNDMSVLMDLGQGWITAPNADPAFILVFDNATEAGQPYCGQSYFCPYGNAAAAIAGERFQPTTTIIARRVSFCVYRKGYPGVLRVAICEDATGSVVVDEPFCAANEVTTWDKTWASHVFSSPVTLRNDRVYRVYVYQTGYVGDTSNYYMFWAAKGVSPQNTFGGTSTCAFSQNAETLLIQQAQDVDVLFRFDTDGIEVVRLTSFRVSPEGATIVVETNKATNATLEYGADTSYGASQTSEAATEHTFVVTGLAPGTTCHYRVHFVDPADPTDTLVTQDCRFKTDPGNQPIDVTVFGDTQSMDYNAMVALMAQYPHDIVLTTGDMVGLQELTGTSEATYDRAWREWRWLLSDLTPLTRTAPLYTALGNHDDHFDTNPAPLQAYKATTLMPTNGSADRLYYSFDYGPAHFLVLDTCKINGSNFVEPAQLVWAENDLSTSTKQWKIVVLHVPVYGLATDDQTGGWRCSNYLALHDMFKRNGVQLVLQGHRHVYNRFYKDNVCYVTTGLPCLWNNLSIAQQPDALELGWTKFTSKPNSGGDWLTIPGYLSRPGWLQLQITPTTVTGAYHDWLGQSLDTFGLPYGPPSPPDPPGETTSVGQAKRKNLGDTVQISGTVTCTENDAPHRVYVQDDLSRSGIWVSFNWQLTTHRGDFVQFIGSLATESDELKLNAYLPTTPISNYGAPKPMTVSIAAMGGGATGSWPGIYAANGLATVGSLVRVVGTVSNLDEQHGVFYISDGSSVVADNGMIGAVRVEIPGADLPDEGRTYAITGISGCKKFSNKLYRVLRVRDEDDMQRLN